MKFIKSLLALALIMFFTGCTQNQPSINTKISDPHVIMENGSLDGWLEFQTVNYVTREDGLMEVEARFRNYSSFDKIVAYKINWMDKNNFIEKSIIKMGCCRDSITKRTYNSWYFTIYENKRFSNINSRTK